MFDIRTHVVGPLSRPGGALPNLRADAMIVTSGYNVAQAKEQGNPRRDQ
jgi:hypothetical protein